MNALETILSNPQSYFSVKQISEALKIRRQSTDFLLRTGRLPFALINHRRFIKGVHLHDYLVSRRSNEGFKSIKEILESYKLPAQKNEV